MSATHRPIAIFRHNATEGPAYFATVLEQHGLAWELIPLDAGAAVPATADAYAGLVFMGGPMSVNDPLPWVEPVCALIRDADAKGIPVLGHCLGGQLMSKAFGGQVTRNAVKEIGWGTVTPATDEVSRQWLGRFADAGENGLTVFQWHGETFSIPAGATRLAHSDYCANQMFVRGPHLAMQCHVEMTPEQIALWSHQWADEIASVAHQPSVQNGPAMAADTPALLPQMRELADQLYSVWLRGLKP